MITLTDADAEVVRSALRMLWEGMRESSNEMWTGTDEFFDTYRRAQHILDGNSDPGPNSLLLR